MIVFFDNLSWLLGVCRWSVTTICACRHLAYFNMLITYNYLINHYSKHKSSLICLLSSSIYHPSSLSIRTCVEASEVALGLAGVWIGSALVPVLWSRWSRLRVVGADGRCRFSHRGITACIVLLWLTRDRSRNLATSLIWSCWGSSSLAHLTTATAALVHPIGPLTIHRYLLLLLQIFELLLVLNLVLSIPSNKVLGSLKLSFLLALR